MSNNKIDFFIVGYPRSGTTLVATLLNGSNSIYVPAETHFFRRFIKNTKIKNKEDFIQKFKEDKRLKDLNASRKLIAECTYSTSTPQEAFACILTKLAKKYNKKIIGEKTPSHILEYKAILKAYPNTKIIYILRDGRDCVYSNIKEKWTYSNAFKHAAEWNIHISHMESLQSEHPNSLLVMKYEDIINEPENSCQEMAEFIGTSYSQSSQNNFSDSQPIPSWERDWKSKANEKPDSRNKYKWKKKDKVTNAILTSIMHTNLNKYNYDISDIAKNKYTFNYLLNYMIYNTKTYPVLKKLAYILRKIKIRK